MTTTTTLTRARGRRLAGVSLVLSVLMGLFNIGAAAPASATPLCRSWVSQPVVRTLNGVRYLEVQGSIRCDTVTTIAIDSFGVRRSQTDLVRDVNGSGLGRSLYTMTLRARCINANNTAYRGRLYFRYADMSLSRGGESDAVVRSCGIRYGTNLSPGT